MYADFEKLCSELLLDSSELWHELLRDHEGMLGVVLIAAKEDKITS